VVETGKLIVIPIIIYLVWVLAAYLLEGRINLLQKPDRLGRTTYAIVANIAIGTVIAIWLLRPSISDGFVTTRQLGFRTLKRTLIVVAIASAIGSIIFVVQRPESLDPIVVLNIFAQVLPTSIAEVVVCWVAIGTAFESITRIHKNNGRIVSVIVGAAAATILFGLYHFAHSPPFNSPSMVILLMYPGILTSIVYFIGRDIYATIIFHNFQAIFGVMMGIELASFSRLMYPVLILATASILILIISDLLMVRRAKPDLSAEHTSNRR
jgi:hypothetical protein